MGRYGGNAETRALVQRVEDWAVLIALEGLALDEEAEQHPLRGQLEQCRRLSPDNPRNPLH